MPGSPSQTQKPADETDNARAAHSGTSAPSSLFSQRNKKIAFATTTGLCLAIIGVGTVKAATSDNAPDNSAQDNTSIETSSSDQEAGSKQPESPAPSDNDAGPADNGRAQPGGASNSAETTTDIRVNGEQIQPGTDGRVHREWGGANSHHEVDINVDSSGSSSSSSSSVRVESHSSSSSSSN